MYEEKKLVERMNEFFKIGSNIIYDYNVEYILYESSKKIIFFVTGVKKKKRVPSENSSTFSVAPQFASPVAPAS